MDQEIQPNSAMNIDCLKINIHCNDNKINYILLLGNSRWAHIRLSLMVVEKGCTMNMFSLTTF